MPAPQVYPEPIAFNVIGAAGYFVDGDDHTDEERKMMFETRKILEDESIGVAVTCVRVPVRVCHSEAVNVQTREPLSADEARELLSATPGVVLEDVPTPLRAAGRTRCSSAGSGATSPIPVRSACGSSATTSAKGPPPTPSRSPRCWWSGTCSDRRHSVAA